MKVRPKRLTEQTFEYPSEDGIVKYSVLPLDTDLYMHIAAVHVYRDGDSAYQEKGAISYDTIGYSLKTIEGLDDVDESGHLTPFVLAFENRKIGKRSFKRVTDDCIRQLPPIIFYHILDSIDGASAITVQEVKDINFTLASSQTTSSSAMDAPEKSETMTTDATPDVSTSECTNSEESQTETVDGG